MITLEEARSVAGMCLAYANQAPDADLAAAIGSNGASAGPFVSYMQGALFAKPVTAVIGSDGTVNWTQLLAFIQGLIPLIMPLIQLCIPAAGGKIIAAIRHASQQRRVEEAIYAGMNGR